MNFFFNFFYFFKFIKNVIYFVFIKIDLKITKLLYLKKIKNNNNG